MDRRKYGSKHHVLVDGNGTPMAATVTGANRDDVTELIPPVEKVPPIGETTNPMAKVNFDASTTGWHSAYHGDFRDADCPTIWTWFSDFLVYNSVIIADK